MSPYFVSGSMKSPLHSQEPGDVGNVNLWVRELSLREVKWLAPLRSGLDGVQP